MSIFQERLRILKEESGETQFKIAENIGITPQAFSYYMNGREPSYEILVRIAKYFNVSSDWLIGLSEIKAPVIEYSVINALTGLSEEAITNLINYNKLCENSVVTTLNRMLETWGLTLLCGQIADLADFRKNPPKQIDFTSIDNQKTNAVKDLIKETYGESATLIIGSYDNERLMRYNLSDTFTHLVDVITAPGAIDQKYKVIFDNDSDHN